MPPCIHLGKRKGRWNVGGREFPHHVCALPDIRQCTPAAGHPTLPSCVGCRHFRAALSLTSGIAVVIPCHNYARYLDECLDSVAAQTVPVLELIVVDDASHLDDAEHAAEICERRGVRYLRVDRGNVYLARRDGLEATSAPYVVFLDADDALDPNYLAGCLGRFEASDRVGIVTSDLQMFGDRTDLVHHAETNIESQNWIHAGSMVRRAALEASAAYAHPVPPVNSHADWYVWRQVVRAGWQVDRSPAPYLYRQHPQSMMKARRDKSYHTVASLGAEPVTLVLPLSGREQFWPRLSEWAAAQRQVTDLLIIDTGPARLRPAIRAWADSLDLQSVKFVALPESHGLADKDRNARSTFREVQRAMPLIYRHLRESVTTEYVLIVEDDVLPPANALDRLMRSMAADVAAVSGLVPSRWRPANAIAWRPNGDQIPLAVNTRRVEQVGGTGFGCLLLRRSAMRDAAPFHAGGQSGNYDVEFSRSLAPTGWRWLMDWTVSCAHGEPPAATGEDRQAQLLAALPCSHRGPEIRQDTSNLCGSRGEQITLFACKIHSECSLGKYCQAQTVRTCLGCRDRVFDRAADSAP